LRPRAPSASASRALLASQEADKSQTTIACQRSEFLVESSRAGVTMKIYNAIGYLIILLYMLACWYFAPVHLGLGKGLLIGAAYFLFCWFSAGVYLADVLHLGIAHRALDYKEWFIKAVTVVNNIFGIYVEPVSWVNRHRLHHKNADHDGDPNKLSGDGFWRTAYLCVLPYQCQENLAGDKILKSRTFRVVGNPMFAIVAQGFSFFLLWKLVESWKFALMMWLGMRIFAWWVNMIQNYWTHTRKFGYRRYHDDDNAMNIGEWLPVTATFSACLQNNHHHYPSLLRLSHHKAEYDFGFLTVKAMKRLGLVKATPKGQIIPQDVPLGALEF
jgi:fatty-acid desaturase